MILDNISHPNGEAVSRDTFINSATGELVIRYPNGNTWFYSETGYFVKNYVTKEIEDVE